MTEVAIYTRGTAQSPKIVAVASTPKAAARKPGIHLEKVLHNESTVAPPPPTRSSAKPPASSPPASPPVSSGNSAHQFYYERGGVVHGPYSSHELRKIAATGAIDPDDFLLTEKKDKRIQARNVKGLFPITADRPSVTPTATPRKEVPRSDAAEISDAASNAWSSWLGLVGCVIVVAACFLPAVSVVMNSTVVGTISYVRIPHSKAYFVFGLALISAILILLRKPQLLLATCPVVLGLIVIDLLRELKLGDLQFAAWIALGVGIVGMTAAACISLVYGVQPILPQLQWPSRATTLALSTPANQSASEATSKVSAPIAVISETAESDAGALTFTEVASTFTKVASPFPSAMHVAQNTPSAPRREGSTRIDPAIQLISELFQKVATRSVNPDARRCWDVQMCYQIFARNANGDVMKSAFDALMYISGFFNQTVIQNIIRHTESVRDLLFWHLADPRELDRLKNEFQQAESLPVVLREFYSNSRQRHL